MNCWKRKGEDLEVKLLKCTNILPPELWMEVFARLPAKTLARFRCVCRSWCSIVDDPHFIRMHRIFFNSSVAKPRLLVLELIKGYEQRIFVRSREKFTVASRLVKKSTYGSFKIIGSCNGLVLLLDSGTESSQKKMIRVPYFMLWNPSIGKSLILPKCPIDCYTSLAIGNVPSNDEYKVVAFWYIVEKQLLSIAVYSLRDHHWRTRTIKMDLCVKFVGVLRSGTRYYSSHGVAHWVVPHNNNYTRVKKLSHVLSFDFATEGFSYVDVPDAADTTALTFPFYLNKSFAILSISTTATCIWVLNMGSGNNSWTLWFSGDFAPVDISYMFRKSFSVDIIFYEENTSTFTVLFDGKYVESYNIKSRQVGHAHRFIKSYCRWIVGFMDTYVESLVFCRGL